jgi:hypothetical protein
LTKVTFYGSEFGKITQNRFSSKNSLQRESQNKCLKQRAYKKLGESREIMMKKKEVSNLSIIWQPTLKDVWKDILIWPV